MKKFFIPFAEDPRMEYAAQWLQKHGWIRTESLPRCDTVLLPILTKKQHVARIYGKYVCAARPDAQASALLAANGNRVYDYFSDENYVLQNAYLTAEGVVALLVTESPRSLFGARVLITGYGRIGRALARILRACGAEVTVCSRSKKSASEARFDGCRHIAFIDLQQKNKFDFVVNTVPSLVFGEAELQALPKEALLLDVASFPGGIDELSAKTLSVHYLRAPALPARFSVQTAGELIGASILAQEG